MRTINQPPAGSPLSLVILLSVAAYAGIGLMLTGCELKQTTPVPEPVATQSVTTVALPVSNPPPASVTAITNSAPTNPPPKIR